MQKGVIKVSPFGTSQAKNALSNTVKLETHTTAFLFGWGSLYKNYETRTFRLTVFSSTFYTEKMAKLKMFFFFFNKMFNKFECQLFF